MVNKDSGYKIIVPNFITVKTVEVEGESLTVCVSETPQIDDNLEYPIFEIVTTDEKAVEVESYFGAYNDGQLGHFIGSFEDSRLIYAADFVIEEDLKDIVKDKVFIFDFVVYDKNAEAIFAVDNLYFMFENKAESVEASEETPEAPVPAKSLTAAPTSSKVLVNGKEVAFEAYNIEGNNYFKLRDLAMVVNGTEKQFQVDWDGEKNAISLTTNSAYTPVGKELTVSEEPSDKVASATQSKIYIDNTEVQLTAYNIGGNNYFKLRDIGKAIDFSVVWDGTLQQIKIGTSSGYIDE